MTEIMSANINARIDLGNVLNILNGIGLNIEIVGQNITYQYVWGIYSS